MKTILSVLVLTAVAVHGQPEPPQCTTVDPVVCDNGELQCKMGLDFNDCPLKDFCMAPTANKARDGSLCVNHCPCMANERQCGGSEVDDNGCMSRPVCIPRKMNGCDTFCARSEPCPAGTTKCPPFVENGCPKGSDYCSPPSAGKDKWGKDCMPRCPVNCPPGMRPCPSTDMMGCPVPKCVTNKDPCPAPQDF